MRTNECFNLSAFNNSYIIIGYYFTGASVSGETLWTVVKKIIEELASRNIIVKDVVSDMGSCSRGLWKAAGIKSKKYVYYVFTVL